MRLNTRSALVAGAVEIYDDAIYNVAEIVAYLRRRGDWGDAQVGVGEGIRMESRRNNRVAFFNPLEFTCPPILRDFASTVWHYLNDYGQRFEVGFGGMEPVNVNEYAPGEFYKPHSDDGPGQARVISALVYLNDVAEGGHTEFVHHGVSVSPKAGRLIIFPSNYAYAHAAHPPISGTKYSAAFWTTRQQ